MVYTCVKYESIVLMYLIIELSDSFCRVQDLMECEMSIFVLFETPSVNVLMINGKQSQALCKQALIQ